MTNILDISHIKWTNLDSIDLDNEDNLQSLFADTVKIRKNRAVEEQTDNAIEERNKQNFIDICNKLIIGKDLNYCYKNLNNVDTETFENFTANNTIFTKNGKHDDYLIIALLSKGNMDTKYSFPHTSFRPNCLRDIDIPCIFVSEDSLAKPYWYSPPNMVDGNGAVNRKELNSIITELARKISKCKKVVILGDCRNVAGALSIANELDFVTHAFLLNGLTSMHPNVLTRAFNLKNGKNIDPWMLWTYIKGNELLKNVDEKHTDPFKHLRKGLQVYYWYGAFDSEFYYFKDYAYRYIRNVYSVNYKFGNNAHFIMPHWDKKILPEYISDLIVKS